MRKVILVFVLMGLAVAEASSYTMATSPGKGLILEGASEVLMPHVNIVSPEGNWTYPYDYYPVYAQNKAISGILGSGLLAGSQVGVAAIRLKTSSFQEALRGLFNLSASSKNLELLGFSAISLNRTGKANVTLPGMPPGLFALVAVDLSKLAVQLALPMLVANDQISTESVDRFRAGDVLEVRIKILSGQGNISRDYGAAISSWTEYRGARIDMRSTRSGMISTISIGNESLEIQGEPKISRNLMEKLLPILPPDSAIAMEKSNRTESEISLLTDATWKPGRYVLTCGVYSSKGLDGISQKIIEMT
jgi:methanogen extracellular protein (TIGR04279 family)